VRARGLPRCSVSCRTLVRLPLCTGKLCDQSPARCLHHEGGTAVGLRRAPKRPQPPVSHGAEEEGAAAVALPLSGGPRLSP
jgi:hypothetical protein